MPDEEETPLQLGMTLEDRYKDLSSKSKAQKKALEARRKYRDDNFKPGESDFSLEEFNKKMKEFEDAINSLNKDISNELLEYEAHKRKNRYKEWPQWWNLWIGGYIAAVIVDLIKGLGKVIDLILRNLNNPEFILEKAFDAIKEIAKKLPSLPTIP